ncbi:sulfur transferase domain-containing protein [uncultured Paraglaciecola sp.]|uniref:beta-lactamase hydrolase domain-containing protein n=1 Tax=uncultured Paraglaciecola sp. TaxID=1765024 RepID=UPI0030DCA841|tara:strand:- start:12640 stop:13083 length:444 start_codon:yes stop_codon:yes gene_type:complete
MKKVSHNFSISGPINDESIETLKAQGVTKIVNVRMDDEERGQESAEQMAIKVRAHGIEYVHIPVKANSYSEEDIAEFVKQLATGDDKVHAFCRTGNRAIHLWALANASTETLQYIEEKCQKSHCNISSVKELMQGIEREKVWLGANI